MSPAIEMSKPAGVAGARDDASAWVAYRERGVSRLIESITLRNSAEVTVRPIQPDDVERLQAFHLRLSPDTIALRYFRAAPTLSTRDAIRLTHLDYVGRMALVATTRASDGERIIGVVRYERVNDEEAELAFVVEDAWQGMGISSHLLARLLHYGRRQGFETMTAITMATNVRMRAVMAHAGYPMTSRYADGCLNLRLDLGGGSPSGASGSNPHQAA